ncbi:unnamed protein product [Danaus chrysippus]|uniref:(African queen) hypothetical protein n=1 Tax=Danaus chrysippus TaxID=151541 RepID=A0A8J2QKE2_9NEOP|nr:unnamed protein product [Danaus chrysippus]
MTDTKKILLDFLDTVLDDRGYKQRDVHINEIKTEGNNYTSALFTVNVKTEEKELKLFAKVAQIGKEMRVIANADNLFRTERFVYNKLVHIYNNLQKHLDEEHKFIFPEFYGVNSEYGKETVILENLNASGYKPHNRLKSMNWDQGRVGVESLARFHALSFKLSQSDPEGFAKIADDMVYILNTASVNENTINQFIEMVENAVKVLKQEHREKVRNFMYRPDLYEKYNKPLSTPVLAHGDYRLSNMLFKRKGHDLNAVVVDYQTLHTGCPVSDLFYFIFTGSDEHFRRLYYNKLINHYYTSLEEALKRLAVDPVEVYPRENFESDMKQLLPYVVQTAVVTLPMVVVEAESMQKWDTEDADFSSLVLKPTALFAQRFTGIINDLIRWGVI